MPPKKRKLPDWFLNQSASGKNLNVNTLLGRQKKKSVVVGDLIKQTVYCLSPEEFLLLSKTLILNTENSETPQECLAAKKIVSKKRMSIDIDSPADDIFSNSSNEGVTQKIVKLMSSNSSSTRLEKTCAKINVPLLQDPTSISSSNNFLFRFQTKNETLSFPEEPTISSTFDSTSDTVPVLPTSEFSIIDDLM